MSDKTDVDGYPKICYICGEPAKKTGDRAIEYMTTISPSGRTIAKLTRHMDCQTTRGDVDE